MSVPTGDLKFQGSYWGEDGTEHQTDPDFQHVFEFIEHQPYDRSAGITSDYVLCELKGTGLIVSVDTAAWCEQHCIATNGEHDFGTAYEVDGYREQVCSQCGTERSVPIEDPREAV